MKKDIHPKSYELEITVSKDKMLTASTSKAGKVLVDVDYRKHPAWNKDAVSNLNESNQSVIDFKKKFAGLSFGVKKK
ncbi:MAG: hypothetical protein DGJ47_000620 [Rickettsiaceae bacterium]